MDIQSKINKFNPCDIENKLVHLNLLRKIV